jgi:hypothetical protein
LLFGGKNPDFFAFMRPRLVVLTLAVAALFSGCREAKVTYYRVPKEKTDSAMPGGAQTVDQTAPAAGATMATTAVPTASGADLTWTAPSNWKPKAPGAMRKGSFSVVGEGGAEADLSITAFPGDVGGELANFNRWRGQIKLPPLQESELASAATRIEHDGLTFVVVDFVNSSSEKPQRILGAVVPFKGATWFFKLTGPDVLVAREKPAFLAFLETVRAPASP